MRVGSDPPVSVTSMTGQHHVFVSRLAGMAVRDPSGERLGRVTDAVAGPALPEAPVLGLVVRVRRRPIFVPASRLETIDRPSGIAGSAVLAPDLDADRADC